MMTLGKSTSWLLCLAVTSLVPSCRQGSGAPQASEPSPAADAHSSPAASLAGGAGNSASPAYAAEQALDAGSPTIVRRGGSVSVEPLSTCAEASTANDGGAKPDAPRTATWLSDPKIQAKRPGEAIQRELANWQSAVAGTYLDDRRRAMGIVLHRDFADYDGLRQKLEAVNGPLQVVLRPACYPRQQIDEARRVLEGKAWHPRAKSVSMLWHFDAGSSAFDVSVDESAPEVAQALDQQLKQLVRTRLIKLAPH